MSSSRPLLTVALTWTRNPSRTSWTFSGPSVSIVPRPLNERRRPKGGDRVVEGEGPRLAGWRVCGWGGLEGLAEELPGRRHGSRGRMALTVGRGLLVLPLLRCDEGDDQSPRAYFAVDVESQPAASELARNQVVALEVERPGDAVAVVCGMA